MTTISPQGIHHTLTKNEFELLPYIDSRLFLESATARFSGWRSPFDINYLDWERRVYIQHKLSYVFRVALQKQIKIYTDLPELKIIFLGCALGSIASYFVLSVLKEHGLLFKTKIYLYDLLPEPLALTKSGEFEFSEEAAESCGLFHLLTPKDYKALLQEAEILCGNVTELPYTLNEFTVAVAPFIHHHLNLFDKQKACQQMDKILMSGGIALIGDLTFSYEEFSKWLAYHKSEEIPYALESFISLEKHIQFFKRKQIASSHREDIFYTFSLIT